MRPKSSYCIFMANMKFLIDTDLPLYVRKGVKNFVASLNNEELGFPKDIVKIHIVSMKQKELGYERIFHGKDMMLQYYSFEDIWYCEAPGKYGPVTRTTYTENFRKVLYEINVQDYPGHITSIDKVLQLFPMRQLLFAKNIFLLHSSQIIIKGKGILFTGDSGAGKTTQARLWEQFRNAEMVCNDRTAIRRENGVWRTYGFFIDGSEPIYRFGSWKGGCIVALEQSHQNQIVRLKGLRAVKILMKQLVVDAWNVQMCSEMIQRITDLLQELPVYHLKCTPDNRAVECLETQLRKDGIL